MKYCCYFIILSLLGPHQAQAQVLCRDVFGASINGSATFHPAQISQDLLRQIETERASSRYHKVAPLEAKLFSSYGIKTESLLSKSTESALPQGFLWMTDAARSLRILDGPPGSQLSKILAATRRIMANLGKEIEIIYDSDLKRYEASGMTISESSRYIPGSKAIGLILSKTALLDIVERNDYTVLLHEISHAIKEANRTSPGGKVHRLYEGRVVFANGNSARYVGGPYGGAVRSGFQFEEVSNHRRDLSAYVSRFEKMGSSNPELKAFLEKKIEYKIQYAEALAKETRNFLALSMKAMGLRGSQSYKYFASANQIAIYYREDGSYIVLQLPEHVPHGGSGFSVERATKELLKDMIKQNQIDQDRVKILEARFQAAKGHGE